MSKKAELKPFAVVLSLKPAVRLPAKLGTLTLNFAEPDGLKQVFITKIEDNLKGTVIQTGLRFRVSLSAENIRKAIDSAKALADGIVSFLTMMTGRGMDIPKEEIAYELTPEAKEREFLQVFYDPPVILPSRRQVDPQRLIDFIDRQLKLQPLFSERVARAIRWYRLGAMVTDIFDQFNCFWIGLEALNPLLQQKLSAKDDPVVCPKCGHNWVGTPTVSGIRSFIQDKIKEGKLVYKKIRGLRIDIMHSRMKLKELQSLVSEYAPMTGEVLFRAICYVSGFDEWETIPHGAILKEFPLRGELQCLLIGGDPSSLGVDGEDPHFQLVHDFKELKSNEEGSVTYTVSTSLTAKIGPNVQFRPQEIRLYGDSETKGAILSKTVQTADGKETPV
jgi:hypothetical protein